jgi:hypothetical protein
MVSHARLGISQDSDIRYCVKQLKLGSCRNLASYLWRRRRWISLIAALFLLTTVTIEAARSIDPRRSESILRAFQLAQLHPVGH